MADVYLNGQFLGEHRGGFGAFCFEITQQLSDTGTNLLAVRVDNTKSPDIAPLAGDFSVYGGLYRPVHLIVTDEENIRTHRSRFAGRRVVTDKRDTDPGGAGCHGANFQRHVEQEYS